MLQGQARHFPVSQEERFPEGILHRAFPAKGEIRRFGGELILQSPDAIGRFDFKSGECHQDIGDLRSRQGQVDRCVVKSEG